jgi:pyruvate/2-oxoglutarate dehydrogenase complex dihydrolipoamide acyltransferase (E2) component
MALEIVEIGFGSIWDQAKSFVTEQVKEHAQEAFQDLEKEIPGGETAASLIQQGQSLVTGQQPQEQQPQAPAQPEKKFYKHCEEIPNATCLEPCCDAKMWNMDPRPRQCRNLPGPNCALGNCVKGLCPGGKNNICCVPLDISGQVTAVIPQKDSGIVSTPGTTIPPDVYSEKDRPCIEMGGRCLDNCDKSKGPNEKCISGKCGGPSHRKCAVPVQVATEEKKPAKAPKTQPITTPVAQQPQAPQPQPEQKPTETKKPNKLMYAGFSIAGGILLGAILWKIKVSEE